MQSKPLWNEGIGAAYPLRCKVHIFAVAGFLSPSHPRTFFNSFESIVLAPFAVVVWKRIT